MLETTLAKTTEIVTPTVTARFAEAPKRLTLEQAQALFLLIEAFRPDWASDWKAVMGTLQQVSLAGLEGHEVVSYVVKAAATEPDRQFAGLDFTGALHV